LQKLLIRYTLDVMHCKMNIAKNFLKTITGIKDTVKVRRDLQKRNIWPHLSLTRNSERGRKMVKPQASYVLTPAEFEEFV
jgi:cAMP phosphodiesterase